MHRTTARPTRHDRRTASDRSSVHDRRGQEGGDQKGKPPSSARSSTSIAANARSVRPPKVCRFGGAPVSTDGRCPCRWPATSERVHGHAWRHRSRGIGSARPRPCLLAGDDDHAVVPAEVPADGVGRVRAAERTHRLGDPQQRGTPLDGHNPADRAELDEVGPAGGPQGEHRAEHRGGVRPGDRAAPRQRLGHRARPADQHEGAPGQRGHRRQRGLQRLLEHPAPPQRRRRAIGREEAQRQLPRPRDLVGVRDPRRDRRRDVVRDPGLVEVAQVRQQGRVAHRRNERLPRLGVQRALQPARHRLPRHRRRREHRRRVAVRTGDHGAPLGHRQPEQPGPGGQQRERLGHRHTPAVPPVDGVHEERALAGVPRRRVHELEHVGEPEPAGLAVVRREGPLPVERRRRVRDAALDRLRQAPSVASDPVGEELPGSSAVPRAARTSSRLPPAAPACSRARTASAAVTSAAERSRAPVRSQPTKRRVQPGSSTATRATSSRSRSWRSPADSSTVSPVTMECTARRNSSSRASRARPGAPSRVRPEGAAPAPAGDGTTGRSGRTLDADTALLPGARTACGTWGCARAPEDRWAAVEHAMCAPSAEQGPDCRPRTGRWRASGPARRARFVIAGSSVRAGRGRRPRVFRPLIPPDSLITGRWEDRGVSVSVDVDPRQARLLWHLVEPVHAVTYFAPQARAAAEALGLRGFWAGYVVLRSAPLGVVPPAVVTAAFHGFAPRRVEKVLPAAWDVVAPAAALDARASSAAAALRQVCGQAGVDEAHLVRAADALGAAAAAADVAGRVLAAANAALPPRHDPVERLWQATTVLREHRGDGHVAALVTAGVSPSSPTCSRSRRASRPRSSCGWAGRGPRSSGRTAPAGSSPAAGPPAPPTARSC